MVKEHTKKIGDRILELRSKRNMTQDELAAKLGTSKQSISLWENGERHPRMKYLIKMEEYFKEDFMIYAGNSYRLIDPRLAQFAEPRENYSRIDESEKIDSLMKEKAEIFDMYMEYVNEMGMVKLCAAKLSRLAKENDLPEKVVETIDKLNEIVK